MPDTIHDSYTVVHTPNKIMSNKWKEEEIPQEKDTRKMERVVRIACFMILILNHGKNSLFQFIYNSIESKVLYNFIKYIIKLNLQHF